MAPACSRVYANRNARTVDEIAKALPEALGAEKLIWSTGLLNEDITDYHIDALVRFVAMEQVLIQLPPKCDSTDPWATAACQSYDLLKKQRMPRVEN